MSKARKAGGSNGDPKLEAVQVSYAALRDLTVDEQLQVLSSVRALLNLPSSSGGAAEPEAGDTRDTREATSARKRLSLVELLSDKKPKTNPERIALFAYYREHVEGSSAIREGRPEALLRQGEGSCPDELRPRLCGSC